MNEQNSMPEYTCRFCKGKIIEKTVPAHTAGARYAVKLSCSCRTKEHPVFRLSITGISHEDVRNKLLYDYAEKWQLKKRDLDSIVANINSDMMKRTRKRCFNCGKIWPTDDNGSVIHHYKPFSWEICTA